MTDTHQFDDYSKYKSTLFDVEKKAKGREKGVLKDRKRACGMGVALPEFEGSHLEAKQCSVISGKDWEKDYCLVHSQVVKAQFP